MPEIKLTRELHTYEIPKSLQRAGLATRIGMSELSVGEELVASREGGQDYMKSLYAATKTSVRQLDDKPADMAAVEAFWQLCGSGVRDLLCNAHNRLTGVTKEEKDSFFASEIRSV
jgi:hypothetical protein